MDWLWSSLFTTVTYSASTHWQISFSLTVCKDGDLLEPIVSQVTSCFAGWLCSPDLHWGPDRKDHTWHLWTSPRNSQRRDCEWQGCQYQQVSMMSSLKDLICLGVESGYADVMLWVAMCYWVAHCTSRKAEFEIEDKLDWNIQRDDTGDISWECEE